MPFAPINGIRLYYESTGEGPPVVFAHGAGGNHSSWWQQVPVFVQAGYRCVTFDHRAFGLSTEPAGGPGRRAFADDLRELMDYLEVDRFHLVVQSMGGRTAAGLLARHPDRLRSVVLAGTTAGAVDEASRSIQAEVRAKSPPAGEFAIRALSPGFARRRPDMAFLYRQILRFNPPRPADFLQPPPPDYRGSMHGAFIDSGVPILYLAGAEDSIVAEAAMRRAHELVTGSRYVVHPEAGHSVYFEDASFFNRTVLEFIRECETGAAERVQAPGLRED